MAEARQYRDGWWTSEDGLRLHYRDYPGAKDRLPLICIPGLTRNARDFAHVAQHVDPARRTLCVELRGRGESGYASDASRYTPLTYLADLEALLADLKIKRFIALGTSLGGILTALLAAAKPGRVAGALINDIGPVIDAAGLGRIKSAIGKSQSWPTWIHAARDLSDAQQMIYPDYELVQWLALAKRLFRVNAQGRIVPDYDLKIAEQVAGEAATTDMWPIWEALGAAPVTILRGSLSDILSAKTAKDMVKRLPNAKLITVAGVGHAPALDEPASLRALEALLKSVGK